MTSEQLTKESNLLVEYRQLKPKLSQWGQFVDKHIIKILQRQGFNLYYIQIKPTYRIKGEDSLIKKVFYRDVKYQEGVLKDVNDKVGTRIVLVSELQVKQVENIILDERKFWSAEVSRSLNKGLDKDPKTFDYRALHINLTPTNKCRIFKELSSEDLCYYTCELQVRTLLQQAYAEIAHDTVYKGVYGSSSKLVRILSKSEALMEVTDEFFCNAAQEMKNEVEVENSLLNELKKWGAKELNFSFSDDTDTYLTGEIFKTYNATNFDIFDIKRELSTHKEAIKHLVTNGKTYITKQPVVLFIAYLLYTQRSELKRKWDFEQSSLKDIYVMLGMSFGR